MHSSYLLGLDDICFIIISVFSTLSGNSNTGLDESASNGHGNVLQALFKVVDP